MNDTAQTTPTPDALPEPVRVALDALAFDASFVQALPGDPVTDNVSRQVRNACYTRVDPTPVREPRLIAWADEVGELLGVARPGTPEGAAAQILGGNRLVPGMQPYAARYGGHQFGNWAGQLGDGRAITLGEASSAGRSRQELQLKGAGPTPYSRTADGRAVLRSSVREFLCSEAMHHLGIPTTRALALVTTGETVVRDMFYDGNPEPEPGAIVCRVAPSFARFGNFQIHAACGELDALKRLADYVIGTHFPELGSPSPATYVRWFEEVCRRTALLLTDWMRVGFVHGVMNTDNMSALGLTLDYGPYGWLEGYDPDWTPNTTDAQGRRYRYGNQPQIALWNLVQFANALIPLVGDKAPLEAALTGYGETYTRASSAMLASKLGFQRLDGERDGTLVHDMLELLQAVETDMTLFFRRLADVPLSEAADSATDAALVEFLQPAFYDEDARAGAHVASLAAWLRRLIARAREDGVPEGERRSRMNRVNPKYVPRNYLAQLAIDALAQGDATVLERLMAVVRRPYDEQPDHEELAARRPEWARDRPGCSALSCSS